MKKKYILIIVIAVLALFLLTGCGIGGYFIYKNYIQKEETTTKESTESTVSSDELDVEEVDSLRAEGKLAIRGFGDPDEVDAVVMSDENMTSNYMKLISGDEELFIYTETEEEKLYTYVSDGDNTVRFEVDDGTSEEFYSSIADMDPTDEVSDIDTYEEDPDFTVTYEGEEACRDMICHKYKIEESETGEQGVIIIWVDTEERLPRIINYETEYVDGEFDIYYDGVEFDLPTEYDDINIESIFGLQKLYFIVGDFVDLFL